MFWFFSFEGIKQSEPEPTFSTVPTQEQRNGDFSALLKLNNCTRSMTRTPVCWRTDALSASRSRQRNSIEPAEPGREGRSSEMCHCRISLAWSVSTHSTGRTTTSTMPFASDNFSGYLGRLDLNVSEKHKFFWSFRQNDRVEDRSDRFGNDINGNFLSRVNWGTTIDDVYTLSPSLLLNTRAGWTRFVEGNTRQSTGFDPTSLGFPPISQRTARDCCFRVSTSARSPT